MRELALVVTTIFLGYVLGLYVVSRRRAVPSRPAPELRFVFFVPCLNEELVIGTSIERLLALPGNDAAVVVIDDGSDDATADIVRRFDPSRVSLLQRVPPEARKGKGEALNDAYRRLPTTGLLDGWDDDEVIVVIVDADGRLEPNALQEVAPCFADARVAAVQIGVRMYNATDGLLPRLQDFEFVTFTEIYQRARTQAGIAGMGGNGQFNRLSALRTLGDAPWSDCLTEDLDLGIRLLALGWRTSFCSTTWVNQQGVTDVRRFVRQRSRWFQGHLQCWRRVGLVLRGRTSLPATADLLHHLFSPALMLITSLSVAAFAILTVVLCIGDPALSIRMATAGHGLVLAAAYVFTFGLSLPYAYAYWLETPTVSFPRAVGLAHVFTVYSYLWFVAAWMAVGRVLLRRRSWQKTARTTPTGVVRPLPEAHLPPRRHAA